MYRSLLVPLGGSVSAEEALPLVLGTNACRPDR